MAERLLGQVVETVSQRQGDGAVLERAASRLREARETQKLGERQLVGSLRHAAETWADASAASVQAVLQRELGRLSAGLAEQLSRELLGSRRLAEALGRLSCGAELRRQLGEELAPSLRAELRRHFQEVLVPLLRHHVSELAQQLRERLAACFQSLAEEHELAAQRLAREVVPLMDQDLEELVVAAQQELLQPLRERLRQLATQVRELREHARRIERAQEKPQEKREPPEDPVDTKDELQQVFRSGRAEEAFMRAISSGRGDVVLALVSMIQEPGDWLQGSSDHNGAACSRPPPLTLPLRMVLTLALAKQLEQAQCDVGLEWVHELWLAFDFQDTHVAGRAPAFCRQLSESLERLERHLPVGETVKRVRQIKRSVQSTAALLEAPARTQRP